MNNNGPSWKYRRRAVFGSLFFSGVVIGYALLGMDSQPLAETALLSAFGLMGAVTAAYIGGSAYEDVRMPQYNRDIYEDNIMDEEDYEEGNNNVH